MILPPFGCSTAEVYKTWDKLGGPESQSGNDLEQAVLNIYPEMEEWKETLEKHTAKTARLAGSGSTWFGGNYPEKVSSCAHDTRELLKFNSSPNGDYFRVVFARVSLQHLSTAFRIRFLRFFINEPIGSEEYPINPNMWCFRDISEFFSFADTK